MSFCPQCGAPTSPGLSFCTACGRTLSPVAPAPPAPGYGAPPAAPGIGAAPPPAAPARPVGKKVEPWIVILLAIVTLGVYPFILWWRTSREMDAFAGSHAHPMVRVGVMIGLVALAVGFVLGAMAGYRAFMAAADDPTAFDEAAFTREMTSNPLYLLLAVAQVGGALVLYLGLGRMWRALQEEEMRRGRPDPVRPGPLVGIGLASALVGALSTLATYVLGTEDVAATVVSGLLGALGFGLFVALLWVMYTTQKRLNELWQAASPPGWA